MIKVSKGCRPKTLGASIADFFIPILWNAGVRIFSREMKRQGEEALNELKKLQTLKSQEE